MRRPLMVLAALFLCASAAAQATCRPSPFGTSCGPRLAATVQQNARFNVVRLQVTKAADNAPGVLVFGGSMARIRIPGSRCALLTTPVVFVAFQSDGNGRGGRTISVPRVVVGTVFAQAVSVDVARAAITSSNGIRLTCRK